jgi:hypothetical protein
MTATSLCRDTLRFVRVELQLACEASVPSDPYKNDDAMK